MGVKMGGVLDGNVLKHLWAGSVGVVNVFMGGVGGCGCVSPRGERQACLSFFSCFSPSLSLCPSFRLKHHLIRLCCKSGGSQSHCLQVVELVLVNLVISMGGPPTTWSCLLFFKWTKEVLKEVRDGH